MLRFNFTLLFSVAVLFGCAKEKEYDTVYKDVDIQKKSAIKTHKVITDKQGNKITTPIKYMYVPMSLGTPRKVRSAYPFQQGDEKLVRLQWSETGLEVLEIEKDARFSGNELNDSPVLTIPVKYSSYRCREDQFGDCTNTEEENTELEWSQKTHFVPQFEKISMTELNSLDLFNVSPDSCTSLEGTRLKDYEISDGVINVEIEKTYRLRNSFSCILQNWINDDFSSNSFKVRFFYSLVELDQVASPDYQAIEYPTADHDEFGFFKTKISKLSADYDSQRKEEQYLVNRWNPKRENGELVYYLSKNFNKAENKILKEATYKGIALINRGLKKIGNPFSIVLKEQRDQEVSPGDLRYNQLILIEDPLANGLLGYGPSVKNPLTGEIVKAHVNMYGGVLKAISRRAYDEAVDLSEAKLSAQGTVETEYQVAASALSNLPAALAENLATIKKEQLEAIKVEGAKVDATKITLPSISRDLKEVSVEKIEKMLDHRMRSHTSANRVATAHLLQQHDNFDEFEAKAFEFEQQNMGVATVHKHKPEFFPIGGTTKMVFPELKQIKGILKEDGSLKRWVNLSQAQKDQAVAIITEKAWVSTLIHEFGHNLGLRHNFSGSFDRHNFLNDADLASMGVDPAHRPAYSSIMDYAVSEYNQLASFGHYDLAALRFAYKREVEVVNATEAQIQSLCEGEVRANPELNQVCQPRVEIMKLDESLSSFDKKLEAMDLKRKAYSFCTDENAGLSSTCNRFDEGTSLTEIAKFRSERYENMYKYRNFRDGRLDFSAYDIPSYLFWRRYELSQIRDILEEYEFFKTIFDKQNPQIMISGCSDEQVKTIPVCGMINDRIKSVEVVGNMMINILKTPDHICATVKPEQPNIIVAYKKLGEIYDDIKFDLNYVPKSCFDGAIKTALLEEGLVPVGETGKFLNGFKDMNPRFKYATDRAVLGTWPDKLMAMRALFNRTWRNRTTDKAHLALVDIPSIREKAINVLAHYTMGEALENPLPFTMENGQKFQAPYVIGNDYQVEQLEDVFYWVKKHLGMSTGGRSNLIELATRQSARETSYGEGYSKTAYEASNMATVRKYQSILPEALKVPEFSYIDIGDRTYYASEVNIIAKFMIDGINTKASLDEIDKELIAKVLLQRTNPVAPADLSAEQVTFFKLPGDVHAQLIDLASKGADIPEEAFIQVFGEKDGPLIARIFAAGTEAMQTIANLKQAIMTTPSEGAGEVEIALFEYPINILSSYVNGGLTDAIIDFYRAQLRKLPAHKTKQ